MIGREPVFSTWYGRRHQQCHWIAYIILPRSYTFSSLASFFYILSFFHYSNFRSFYLSSTVPYFTFQSISDVFYCHISSSKIITLIEHSVVSIHGRLLIVIYSCQRDTTVQKETMSLNYKYHILPPVIFSLLKRKWIILILTKLVILISTGRHMSCRLTIGKNGGHSKIESLKSVYALMYFTNDSIGWLGWDRIYWAPEIEEEDYLLSVLLSYAVSLFLSSIPLSIYLSRYLPISH